ncbi:aldo/keto reductase [Kribbella sp. NPDC004536]|uniref:aldo/keto reductase n=1 Tax=Kribbella sp. NPDC004536 TaxID=3364106 RepID=UPI003673D47F
MTGQERLGDTGLSMPRLGLGTATFGHLYEAVSPAEAVATVARAIELGVRYVDTAPAYGLGRAESLTGLALRSVDVDPAEIVVSSKAGRLLRPWPRGESRRPAFPGAPRVLAVEAWHEAGIRRSVEDSLTRSGLDHLDIVYLHDPDEHESEVYDTAYPALAALRKEGAIAAIGVGMNHTELLTRFVDRLELDVVLLAGRYTLLEQGALHDLLPACARRGTRVVIGGAFNSGLLADPTGSPMYNHAPAPPAIRNRAEAINRVCRDHGVDIVSAALQFPLLHPAVITVLAGMRSPAEVERNVAGLSEPIPPQLWSDLHAAGLLDPATPLPPQTTIVAEPPSTRPPDGP